MNRDNNRIDELLVKYLLGEANAEEHLALGKWRTKKQEHERYFAQFKFIWEQSKVLEGKSTIGEDEAWERMKTRLSLSSMPDSQAGSSPVLFRYMMRIAAVLLLGVGAYFFYEKHTDGKLLVQSDSGVKVVHLPDGSVVTLNKNASISYPKRFSGTTRAVVLSGEAFFTIIPNKSLPFIIEANGVEVKVIGTSFNVKTALDRTEVIVETGIVEVIKQKNSVRLNPSEKAVVTKESAPVKDISKDVLYNYYRTQEFVCNNTPLWRLVEVLNEAYNARIIIRNPAIKDLPLTTTFKNENLNDILNIIGETLDISAERNGAEIVLQ